MSDEDAKRKKKEEKEKNKIKRAIKRTEEARLRLNKQKEDEIHEYIPIEVEEKGYQVLEDEEITSSSYYKTFKAKNNNENLAARIYDLEHKELMNKDQQKNLRRQIVILNRLDSRHQNIIGVRDIFQTHKRVYMFMEFAANGTVQNYININGAVNEQQGKKWFYDMLRGLHYLHLNGIAHKNIRTDNTLLTENLTIKLSGFDLTRLYIDPFTGKNIYSETATNSGPYQSPEVIKGDKYDPRALDVWSTGVFLFYVLNKRQPFDNRDLLRQQLSHGWKKKFKTQVSNELMEVLAKVFECNFKKRISVKNLLKHPYIKSLPDFREPDEKQDIIDQVKSDFISQSEVTGQSSKIMSKIGSELDVSEDN